MQGFLRSSWRNSEIRQRRFFPTARVWIRGDRYVWNGDPKADFAHGQSWVLWVCGMLTFLFESTFSTSGKNFWVLCARMLARWRVNCFSSKDVRQRSRSQEYLTPNSYTEDSKHPSGFLLDKSSSMFPIFCWYRVFWRPCAPSARGMPVVDMHSPH